MLTADATTQHEVLGSYLSDNISAFGAAAVGLAAIGTLLLSLHQQRRRDKDECDERVRQLRLFFREGTRYERRKP